MSSTKLAGIILGTFIMPQLFLAAGELPPSGVTCEATGGYMPQPRPSASIITLSDDGSTTYLTTGSYNEDGDSLFENSVPNSFGPNPTNLLPTRYGEACDSDGAAIPNTLTSTPDRPYNLQENTTFTEINGTAPQDDLDDILDHVFNAIKKGQPLDPYKLDFAVDILEGNPLTDRAYSGFPLLHYKGPEKTKVVDGLTKTVTVNQVWSGGNIESDTSYIDPSAVMDEEWTVHYVINVLNRGHEDFAPAAMVFDKMFGQSNIIMDQTFFPMEEGLRYEFDIKQVPGRVYNLTYHWGWRQHPPRVQVHENVLVPLNGMPRNFAEIQVFGENPSANEESKLAAIAMIGDLAPAKRMWTAFREMSDLNATHGPQSPEFKTQAKAARAAYYDWLDRTSLPSGVKPDPESDITLFYVNNTIYGSVSGYVDDAQIELPKFKRAGDQVSIKLLNGDYFLHTYVLVDFGGSRGWENTFHNTVADGGAGPWFTFGRAHFHINTTAGAIPIPPATEPPTTGRVRARRTVGIEETLEIARTHASASAWSKIASKRSAKRKAMRRARPHGPRHTPSYGDLGLGEHKVEVTFTYEPSPRLRMYQFDALHHDVAVWSVH